MSDAIGYEKGPVSQSSSPLVLRLTMSPSSGGHPSRRRHRRQGRSCERAGAVTAALVYKHKSTRAYLHFPSEKTGSESEASGRLSADAMVANC